MEELKVAALTPRTAARRDHHMGAGGIMCVPKRVTTTLEDDKQGC